MFNAGPGPYDRLGGEPAVRALVDRFYDLMSELPEAKTILALHPSDLKSSREKLFMFMSGWLGGPQLYMQAYGHPRLRMRHMPFRIDAAARDAWMRCMSQALDEATEDVQLREQLHGALARLADHMRNVDEASEPASEG